MKGLLGFISGERDSNLRDDAKIAQPSFVKPVHATIFERDIETDPLWELVERARHNGLPRIMQSSS